MKESNYIKIMNNYIFKKSNYTNRQYFESTNFNTGDIKDSQTSQFGY